jgi:uncharacterized protein
MIAPFSRLACATALALSLAYASVGMAQETVTADDPLASLSLEKKLTLAKAGDDEAKFAVAEAYELGRGTPPDLISAAKWYRDLALAGNLEAQYRLAIIVRNGTKGLRKDMTSAVTLLSDAATKLHAGSQYELGLMYESGLGVEKSDAKAIEWYTKAAEQRHAAAQRNLGLIYVYGRGTKTNVQKALGYFESAAASDDGWANNNLGALYEQGWGVARNPVKARELYARAIALGVGVAEMNIKRLDSQPKP